MGKLRFALELSRRALDELRWSQRGSCGNAGCTDPECRCSYCGEPIGVDEFDSRWAAHPDYCVDCVLCRDQVPTILFRTGPPTLQANLHWNCFEAVSVLDTMSQTVN